MSGVFAATAGTRQLAGRRKWCAAVRGIGAARFAELARVFAARVFAELARRGSRNWLRVHGSGWPVHAQRLFAWLRSMHPGQPTYVRVGRTGRVNRPRNAKVAPRIRSNAKECMASSTVSRESLTWNR